MSFSSASTVKTLAASRATTAALLVSAVALWAFIFVDPSQALAHSNDLVLHAAPTVGSEDAPVQLVYFYRSDCAYCTEMSPLVRRLVRENSDLVYARFVQITTDGSVDGPVADICAERVASGTFRQREACLSDSALREGAEADLALAERLGVDAVPAVILGSSLTTGAVPYATLDSLLQVTVADL